MTTFSQLVDKMVAETKRPDLQTEIGSYLNQTLRELHMEPGKGNAVFFRDNLKENQITSNVDTGFFWTVPKPSTFQGLTAVRYESVVVDHDHVWAKEFPIGRGMSRERHYYYRAANNVFFHGYGGVNGVVSLAWYEFVPSLTYYAVGVRPAQYAEDPTGESDGWTYAPSITTPDQQTIAQIQCSNWLLLRWATVIEEGLRAKVYKRLSDAVRAGTSYSMYSTLRQGLYSSEVAQLGGAW